MDEPALLCRYVGMGRWDWIILGLCGAWLLALLWIAVPEHNLFGLLLNQITAAWVQAAGTIGAILWGIWLFTRDMRHRRAAVRAIVDLAVRELNGLANKEKGKRFTLGNVRASADAVENALVALDSLQLPQLEPKEVAAIALARKQLLTARRRVGFVRSRLKKGSDPADPERPIRFAPLLRDLKRARTKL